MQSQRFERHEARKGGHVRNRVVGQVELPEIRQAGQLRRDGTA